MKIKAIICDVGGVLIRSGDTSKRKVWEERFGLQPGELSKIVYQTEPADDATLGLVKSASIWQDMRTKFSLTAEEASLLVEDFYAGDHLNQEFYDILKKLRKKYKTALLSNAWEDARSVYTQKYHLDMLFDVFVISAEVGMQKPDRKIFLYTLDLLLVSPGEAIFIDDTAENCVAAGKLGMNTIIFTDAKEVIQQMKKMLAAG